MVATKISLTFAVAAGFLLLALSDAAPFPEEDELANDLSHLGRLHGYELKHRMDPEMTALLTDCAMAKLRSMKHSGVTIAQVRAEIQRLKHTVPQAKGGMMAHAAVQVRGNADHIVTEVVTMCIELTMGF